MTKTAIRASAIKSIGKKGGGIGASGDHGKRLDETSQGRVVNDDPPICWSKAGGADFDYAGAVGGRDTDGLELVAGFRAHKKEFGAGEHKSSALALQVLAVVSPEWLEEAGDPKDPDNPRVRELVENAHAWAESWGGKGSVFSLRYDRDEKGSDVIQYPTRTSKFSVAWISVANLSLRFPDSSFVMKVKSLFIYYSTHGMISFFQLVETNKPPFKFRKPTNAPDPLVSPQTQLTFTHINDIGNSNRTHGHRNKPNCPK